LRVPQSKTNMKHNQLKSGKNDGRRFENERPFMVEPHHIANAAETTGGKRYSVGTLSYTRAALINVLFWMLWGDFCLMIMESLLPNVVPLQLRWEGAHDSVIGTIANSLPHFIAILMGPIVGMQSDRHRSPLGRRRPFLLWSLAPVVVSLLLLGGAKTAGEILHRLLLPIMGQGATTAGCTIIWIAIATVIFVVFNTYVMQVYQFLFADVIPKEVMGKFIGSYRAIGAFGSFAFNRWIFGYVEGHTLCVYALAALMYATAFCLLVWRVKEGGYPPPLPPPPGGVWGQLKIFLKESFSHRFYLNLYCIPFFFWASLVPFQTFILFFATQAGQPGYASTLGLTLDQFGKVKGWTFIVQIPIFFLVGPFVDRFHPLRVIMVGALLTGLSFLGCYCFIHSENSLRTCYILNQAATAIYLGAYLALYPRLLPREKYGQFFSANQIFGLVGAVVAPVLCGWFLESLRDYRFIFAWCGICLLLAFAATVTLFCHWKKLGGDLHYAPPDLPPLPVCETPI